VLGTAGLLYFAVFLGLTAADALVTLLARSGSGAVAAFHRAIGEEAGHSSAAPATVAILLYAGVLAPFGEELVFRGVLFRALRARLPVAVAIVLSALAFALLHPYRAAIYQVALVGILSGWVYHRTGSLWPSILAHAAWNTMLTLQAAT
jgi:membrane protease YdiL (CAAX protease family)